MVADISHRGTVGNQKYGVVGPGCQQAAEEFTLGGFIEGRTDFVEQQDGSRTQQATGDGDTLCLALTETAATFMQARVESLRQFVHEVGTGRM